MAEGNLPATTPKSSTEVVKEKSTPTLEVSIGTIVAAIANQLESHPGWRIVLTSAAPVIGLGAAFLFRLGASLLLRQIAIMGAKKTYNEIMDELHRTPPDRKPRIKELEKQADEARQTLKLLRTNKISVNPEQPAGS
ncbi:hypothetical protein [Spirosoma litoris]